MQIVTEQIKVSKKTKALLKIRQQYLEQTFTKNHSLDDVIVSALASSEPSKL